MFCIGVPELFAGWLLNQSEPPNVAKNKRQRTDPLFRNAINVQPQRPPVPLFINDHPLINTGTAQLAWENGTTSALKTLVLD